MAATPRKATTRRAPAKPVAEEVDNKTDVQGTDPVSFKTSATDRVVLFTIDDEEFTIPAKFSPNVSLKFLNEYRKTGNEAMALLGLLERTLGADKLDRLLDWDGLDDDAMAQITDLVVNLAMGSQDNVSGK